MAKNVIVRIFDAGRNHNEITILVLFLYVQTFLYGFRFTYRVRAGAAMLFVDVKGALKFRTTLLPQPIRF